MPPFPYGRAPLVIAILALISGLLLAWVSARPKARADLVLVTFTRPHQEAYQRALPEFERRHGVRVEVQLAHWGSLQSRLQNAMLAETDVPDLVEMLEGSLGYFTRGSVRDIGFLELSEWVREQKLREQIVGSRFSLWSARGRLYGLPHDVHPVMLAYRRDLVEELGIDVASLHTWQDFVEVGQRVTRDRNGDGVVDRYMLDLPHAGGWARIMLLLQKGGGLFDAEGNVSFDGPIMAEIFAWYLEQTLGSQRIAVDLGNGQPFYKGLSDGLALFTITPDWRSRNLEKDLPQLAGKMALMPLPAWEKGGRRTSVWGGTGLCITKRSRHPELALELAKFLYYDKRDLGQRFLDTNIIPPLKEAWALPEFEVENPYFSGQKLGRLYAELAPETPETYSSPVDTVARAKLDEAYSRVVEHYRAHGKVELRKVIDRELRRVADEVRRLLARSQRLEGAK